MVLCNSILTLERRPDERNQPKVGYASPSEHRAGEESLSQNVTNSSLVTFLGVVIEVSYDLNTTRLRPIVTWSFPLYLIETYRRAISGG
jgi:hypothetical protein